MSNLLEDYFGGADSLKVRISEGLEGDFFLCRRQLRFRMAGGQDWSGTQFCGSTQVPGWGQVCFKLGRMVSWGGAVPGDDGVAMGAAEPAEERNNVARPYYAEYVVEWVAWRATKGRSLGTTRTPQFEAVELECPALIYRMCLRGRMKELRDINCGLKTTLNIRKRSERWPTEDGQRLELATAILCFEREGKQKISLREVNRLLTYSNAVISIPSWRPMECVAMRVRRGGQWWHFSFGHLPQYHRNDMGPLDLNRLDKIDWQAAFSQLLRRDLTAALYWRALNVMHQQEELFLENGLNEAFICIDALYDQTQWFQEKTVVRSADYERFLEAARKLPELKGDKRMRKVYSFLERKESRRAYLNRGAFDDKIMRVFKHLDAKTDENRKYAVLSMQARDDLAHGRLVSHRIEKMSDWKFGKYYDWLMQNLQIAMIEFISGRL